MTDESIKEEILVNVTAREVRAALLENGILQEVYVDEYLLFYRFVRHLNSNLA